MLKKIAVIVLSVTLIAGGYLFVRYQQFRTFIVKTHSLTKPVTIVITPGSTWKKVAGKLEKSGVISDSKMFYWMVRRLKMDAQLKKGEFEFAGNVSPKSVAEHIASGKVKLYSVTIPEGLNKWDVAKLLKTKKTLTDADKFLYYCNNRSFVQQLWHFNGTPETCEGILFPSTYRFPRGYSVKQLMRTMANKMADVLAPLTKGMKQSGFSPYDVLILASVIEKETGAKTEQPLISSVFHNRLKRGMKLQSDPTVIYGLLPKFNGNLRKKDLLTDHRWSTYTRTGLPATPICFPGKGAINSVLRPARTSYLYFVATNKGRHYFSKSLKEHNAAVEHYQIKGKTAPFHWKNR